MSLSEQMFVTVWAILVGLIASAVFGWVGNYVRKQIKAFGEKLDHNTDLARQQMATANTVQSLQIEMNNRLDRQNGNLRSHDTKIVELENDMAHMRGLVEGILRGILEGKSLRGEEHEGT